ncbi:hypothetical protein BMI86_13150 [Thioclava sp. DLFJ5-1]|nr:hypothetical protein BMI86_13150 [Thioclava sp. DLFJ5-1]
MALFSFRHSVKTFSAKRTSESRQARYGQTAAHLRYITRRRAASTVLRERLSEPTDSETARQAELSAERRKGRVCERLIVALPIEANHEQRVALVRALAEDLTMGQAAYIAAIHDMSGNDRSNPHAHLVLFDKHEKTGGRGRPRSVIGMARKGAIERAAHGWAKLHNTMMTEWDFGPASMIDARSFEERGIELIPTLHEGAAARRTKSKTVKPHWARVDAGQSRADANRVIREINKTKKAIEDASRTDGLGSRDGNHRERGNGSSKECRTDPRSGRKATRRAEPPFLTDRTAEQGTALDCCTTGHRASGSGAPLAQTRAPSSAEPPFLQPRDRFRPRRRVRRVFRELVMLRDTLRARLLRVQAPCRARSLPTKTQGLFTLARRPRNPQRGFSIEDK